LNLFSKAIRRVGLPLWKTRKISLRDTPPIVSFTFDDFPRSALTNGGAILQSHNARGTYYVAMGLIGITNHEGEHFQMQDLQDLLQQGHELGSHSFGHLSALKTPLQAFRADAMRGESELRHLRSDCAPGNFAYPYGDVGFAAKPAIGVCMRSCRGTRAGINAPFADLNLLKANKLYSKTFSLDSVECLCRENHRQRGWLIFYTHDIRDNPSDYGCTPSEFESAVRAAARSGTTILTISHALDTIQSA
jgi:peptidoglycan/xylan/chitin deacetylase (PgdA/CDA1 family)